MKDSFRRVGWADKVDGIRPEGGEQANRQAAVPLWDSASNTRHINDRPSIFVLSNSTIVRPLSKYCIIFVEGARGSRGEKS
jgi:hypothetical protein